MTPRFESLQAPLYERRKLLEAAVDLYEFYHSHDMELNWINERLPIAHSTNCGKSLDVAQNLLQKHKVTPLTKCFMAWSHIALRLSKPAPAPAQSKLPMSPFTDPSSSPAKTVLWINTNQQRGDDVQNKYNIPVRTAKFLILWSITEKLHRSSH